MVHVDTAASDDSFAERGCVGGSACGEYALHSLRIGGATHLSAGGAKPEVLQREGRWASDAYKAYVRSHGKDASRVADVKAQEGISGGIQPGQSIEWRRVNPPLDLTRQTWKYREMCYNMRSL